MEGALGEIFISHASADGALAACVAESVRHAGHTIFLDSDREDGISPGAAWQRTLLRELRICDAVVFLNSQAGQASMWCHSELVIAIELGKRVYSLDLGSDLPPHPLLRALQGISFDSTIDASIRRLTDNLALDGLAGSTRLRWVRGRSPYPGLAAMDMADAGVFFGREDELRNLVARVDGPLGQRDGDLVIVMGPSGAGKSSFVRAGLAARLAVAHSGWAVATPFEPGIRPLERLLSRLIDLVPGQLTESECRERLLIEGMAAFGEWLANHTEVPAKRILITLDQAEQLATVTPLQECEEFLSVLGGGVVAGSPVTVVMTVRSDRFDEIQRLPVIGAAIQDPFVISPINRSQLAMVIEGPARCADLAFEPGLVSRLIDEAVRGSIGENAEALPFLAFVLREMYDLAEKEDRAVLTQADYERAGRIDGAIIRRTQAAEASLLPASELVLERLLPRFVALSEERLPVARPVPRGQLTPAEQAVVERLEDHRLLVGTGDTVRLAHERLIAAWPRLAKAAADSRDDLLLQARVERQAADWKHGNGELLGREATVAASAWLARQAEPKTNHTSVGEYIRASREALRRRRLRVVSVLSIIVVLALGASVVAVAAVVQRSDAVSQSHLAQSEEMAAEATNLLPADGPLAMLLSLQAYERAHTLQAESALIQATQQPLDDMLVSGRTVRSVAFSPDGHTLAVGDLGGDIRLWDVATRQWIGTLAENSPVNSVAFSPGGQILAAGNYRGDIGLWNVATGRRIATFAGNSTVDSVAFSPDGHILAAGDQSGGISLWNVATGQHATVAESSSVYSVAFSPDGHTLAVGITAGDISLWNMATGRRTVTLVENSSVYSVAFSPDGHTLAVGDYGGDIGLWDVATGRRTATLVENSPVNSVAFSPDGRTLAVGDLGSGIGLWNVATRQRTATLAEGNEVEGVAFSPNGHTLAAGDLGGDIGLWDVASAQRAGPLTEGSPVISAAFSPDGRTLAVGDLGGDIGLWDVASGRRTATVPEGGPVEGVAFSPDGHILAAGNYSGDIGLWDVATGRWTATLAGNGILSSVAFSPDGHTLAASYASGDIGLWNVATGRRTATLAEGSPVVSVAFSPDGHTLAAGGSSRDIGLWNVATGRRTATLAEGSPAYSVAFSSDGHTLAAGDLGGDIGLWDVATGRRTGTLVDGSPLNSVAFSPNGPALVTGDTQGNVGIWNTANRQQFASLADGGAVATLAFSPHGQVLAIGGVNRKIVLLRQNLTKLTPRLFVHLICGKVRTNMTRAQWTEYAPGQSYQKTCP
jgi:WD40 repeat protein